MTRTDVPARTLEAIKERNKLSQATLDESKKSTRSNWNIAIFTAIAGLVIAIVAVVLTWLLSG